MAKSESIGVREFARQVGCSHVLILNLIKAGKMPQNKDGTVPLEEGLIAFENRKKKKAPAEKVKKEPKKKKAKEKVQITDKVTRETLPEDPDDDSSEIEEAPEIKSEKLKKVLDVTEQFNKARLAEKTYQAKLKEIEFKIKKGELIEKSAVEADASRFGAELRERLTSMPVRVAALCERKEAREIEMILQDAIQDALISLQKSIYVKDEPNE